MMDLSDQVFSPGMVYVALSRVKQLENLHLIAFNPQSIIVSTKCLQEINRLRHIYCTDLSQYTLPSVRSTAQRRKRTLTAVLSDTPHPKQTKVVSFGMKRKAESMNEDKQLPPTKRSHTSHRTPPETQSRYRYNPVSEVVCQKLGLRFVYMCQ